MSVHQYPSSILRDARDQLVRIVTPNLSSQTRNRLVRSPHLEIKESPHPPKTNILTHGISLGIPSSLSQAESEKESNNNHRASEA